LVQLLYSLYRKSVDSNLSLSVWRSGYVLSAHCGDQDLIPYLDLLDGHGQDCWITFKFLLPKSKHRFQW